MKLHSELKNPRTTIEKLYEEWQEMEELKEKSRGGSLVITYKIKKHIELLVAKIEELEEVEK